MELFGEMDLSASELRGITQGLYTVALTDGLHESEVAFISDLLGGDTDYRMAEIVGRTHSRLEWLSRLAPPALARVLPTARHRQLFLQAAYMLAWADGKVSFAERASIDAFASALGVPPDLLARIEAQVRSRLCLTSA